MKKRIFSLILVLILAIGLSVPAAAFEDHDSLYVAVSEMDNERLLEQGTSTLPTLSEQYQFDFRVDIVDTIEDNTIAEYAQIFYEQYEYGYGDHKDGALLMIQVEDWGEGVDIVDYYVYGSGKGAELLSTADTTLMFDTLDMILIRSDMLYADAGEVCADAVDIYMSTMASLVMSDMPDAAPNAQPDAAPEDNAPLLVAPNPGADVPAGQEQSGTYIMDNAALLSNGDRILLEGKAQKLSETYGCGVYVLTVDTMDGAEVRDFAKNYYKENNLGVGAYQNGILFMVAMDTRDYVTITYGQDPEQSGDYGIGIYAFTDGGIAYMEEEVVAYLSEGEYADAFGTYLDICEECLSYYDENGEGMVPEGSKLLNIAVVIFLPLLIGLGVCLVFVGQMKTAKAATQADNYVSGFELTAQQDRYSHTTKERRRIETDDDSKSTVDSAGFGGSSGGKF